MRFSNIATVAITVLISVSAAALSQGVQTLKRQAFFAESDDGLFEPLALKHKKISFGARDFDLCGQQLTRKGQSLEYSCKLSLPNTAKISRLKSQISPTKIMVMFGGSKRQVRVEVDQEARSVSVTTAFDSTGLDFELLKFNDDFFKLNAKMAQLVMAEALASQALETKVLESL